MQWNPSSEASKHPSRAQGGSDQFSHYDSGLGKEPAENFKHDSDVSLYESTQDLNTQDSGYEGGKFYQFARSLGVTPQSSWSGKRSFGSLDAFEEEFMDLERLEENADLPTDFSTLLSGKLVELNGREARPLKRAKSEPCTSSNEESIKNAIQRSAVEPDLIGDFTKAYCLPLTVGRHQDLKSITPATLAGVLNGEFEVDSYKIIDCRFPYEFEGGHVKGAVNLYTKDQILGLLNGEVSEAAWDVLIFHCEFSSERAPNLCRLLRNLDRIHNKDVYPKLNYPEMYMLEGGYKKFYEDFGDLCLPNAYKPMLHPDHQKDLLYFKSKSKTASESRFHPGNRGSFKRLGFL